MELNQPFKLGHPQGTKLWINELVWDCSPACVNETCEWSALHLVPTRFSTSWGLGTYKPQCNWILSTQHAAQHQGDSTIIYSGTSWCVIKFSTRSDGFDIGSVWGAVASPKAPLGEAFCKSSGSCSEGATLLLVQNVAFGTFVSLKKLPCLAEFLAFQAF